MRYYPNEDSDYDQRELEDLNAESWMVELLKMNPDYLGWGIHEDYMWKKEDRGWDSPVKVDTWKEFHESWELNDLNELVNFYFHIERESQECKACDCSGYNPETKKLYDDFYDFNRTGSRWIDNITQDEVEALQDAGRLRKWDENLRQWVRFEGLTAEMVNESNKDNSTNRVLSGHDAINQCILVETRAKRLGVWGQCKYCEGRGYIYLEPMARLKLTLWFLHPRKGCSRGVEIQDIKENQLPEVYGYLREAAERNAERFSRIPDLVRK